MKTIIKAVGIITSAAIMASALTHDIYADDKDTVQQGSFSYIPALGEEAVRDRYFFSDSYFSGSSRDENEHLTTMSMALALSTMEEYGSSYVSEVLGDIGFKDSVIGDMNDIPTRNTIGTAIAHKEVYGQEIVAVVIRGSKYDSEWASNLTAGSEGDIQGFSEASEKVLGRIKAYIAENGLKDIKLWITGYSRAGSVADLTGVYINEHTDEFGTNADDLYVYTFEAPAASASDKVYDNIHETRNRNDIINYVYPVSWGIHSNGKVHWIGENKTIVTKTADVGTQGVTVRDSETVAKDEFIVQFMDWLSGELPRENFSGDFDGAIGTLLELYFGKTPAERQALNDYFKGVQEQFSGMDAEKIKEDDALVGLFGDDVIFGICDHNSDKMYEKLTTDLEAVIRDMYAKEKEKGNTALSEDDLDTILGTLYPILRQLGPALVMDMKCHIGMNSEDFLPEYYYDPDYAPGYYEEEADEGSAEELTEAEKGAAAGIDAAFAGYQDGFYAREKYASYNDVPDDGEEHTAEYLEAYRQAYKEEYEPQYALGVSDHRTDYQKGVLNGDYSGDRDAALDIANGDEYGTGYNDEPEMYEDSEPYSEEYIRGYKDGYKNSYDTKFAERPLYHAATFILNLADFTDEHKPKYNWDLVKSLDSYYSGDLQSLTDKAGDNTNPATGSEAVSGIVLLAVAAVMIVVSKKKR